MIRSNETHNRPVFETACHWAARLDDEGLTDNEYLEFTNWLSGSQQHLKEFVEAELLWQYLGMAIRQVVSEVADANSDPSQLHRLH